MQIDSRIEGSEILPLEFGVDLIFIAVEKGYGPTSGSSSIFINGYAITQPQIAGIKTLCPG